jgi:sec-independent protein translocase protein TatC
MNVTAAGRDPDDLGAHTRMSFGDHIEELRMRLLRALVGFLAAMGVGLFLGQPVLSFIQAPVQRELDRFYEERDREDQRRLDEEEQRARQDAANRGEPFQEKVKTYPVQLDLNDGGGPRPVTIGLTDGVAHQLRGAFARPPGLISLTVTEPFMTYFKVSLYCGAILSSPWVFYQLWMFVAAGLYPQEKKYVYLYLPLSLGLFLGGVALGEFAALPLGVRYLLSFNPWLGVEPEIRLSDWLAFAVMMPLVFGAAFQTPLVMLFLERAGIVDVEFYTKNRRIAVFVQAVVAALLAAVPDALNMLMLALPLWGLYELGILLCRFAPRPRQDAGEPGPRAMAEV